MVMKLSLKNTFVKQYDKILIFLIGLLGFSTACNKEPRMEYGTPSASFIINGVVQNQASQPIPNIKVSIRYDSTNTTFDGKFSLKNRTFPTNQTFIVRLSDIDGATNGSYKDKDTTIEFNNNTFKNGDGHWYQGTVEQSVVIKLTSK
jgi:putative lipoprotein (rSAM/lipoprotein system)